MAKFQEIELDLLEPNEGQIEGLPSNPKQIDERKFELLKQDIQKYPEMLEMRGLMVIPNKGKYVIVGGNQRYRAMASLGMKTAPCVVIPEGTDADRLKAYTILDNAPFGQWDWDMLANEWDVEEITSWGVDIPAFNPITVGDDEGEDESEEEEQESGYRIAYELVFNDEAEQTEFYDLLKELKNKLQDYDTISERIVSALRFWKENYEQD